MTPTITIDRATVEQALEALEAMQSYAAAERKGLRICDEAIPALRTALAQQAEPVEPVAAERERCAEYLMQQAAECREDSPTRVTLESCAAVLRLGLHAQAEQAWVCPDSPEHRYAKPGHCEDCGKTLVQEQGCDHCRHPLYAATRCRVCGRVTEQAEPVEPVAYIHRQGNHWEVSERHLDEDEKARGWTEEPLYTAPPQRKPLTEEEIERIRADCVFTPHEYRDRAYGWALHFARAVERAHGIVGQSEDENPSFG